MLGHYFQYSLINVKNAFSFAVAFLKLHKVILSYKTFCNNKNILYQSCSTSASSHMGLLAIEVWSVQLKKC